MGFLIFIFFLIALSPKYALVALDFYFFFYFFFYSVILMVTVAVPFLIAVFKIAKMYLYMPGLVKKSEEIWPKK